jgi:signal transduction histidine kinase
MDVTSLRDHAADMLKAIVADLRTPQTDAEQTAKSKGEAIAPESDDDTAAEVHGAGRAESGFTVGEMVSEYRALRASVIRLWTKANGTLTADDLDELMRFNETIDQALTESITRYTEDLDRSKEMFLAILGHDLRSPLGTVMMGTQFMLDASDLGEPHLTLAKRMDSSARRMHGMVNDLLDFTRGRLGSGVPITRAAMDLGVVLREAIEELTLALPKSVLQLTTTGDLHGFWDAGRLSQMISNLLGNAIEHGAPGEVVQLTVHGEPAEVVLRVQNRGPAIPRSELHQLFSPFKRLNAREAVAGDASHLGLGLYIAERIVAAHGGSIDVRSSAEAGTLFTVRLPSTDLNALPRSKMTERGHA